MDTMTQISFAHPTVRQFAIGAHVLLAGWLLINGVAHEIGVLVKARAGTLNQHANVSSLLAVGVGLLVAGAIVAAGISPSPEPRAPPRSRPLSARAPSGPWWSASRWPTGRRSWGARSRSA